MQKIRTSNKHRKCKFPHCDQILSIYNHEAYCHVHLGYINRGDKIKEYKYQNA
ncbi:MAG: hypothetical protein NTV07_04925 [Candidatus Omnitrophica bacterium]|nr:hypothetical protein [Candidatus Omnitrophota bacterium]